ncbi:MAG: NAD(P)H-dependent flavin oxidoreductase [Streptosporangiaceae bacterium]
MLSTPFTEMFGVDVPIVGAPMAGVSGGRLAAAVTAGGGLGMIGVGNSTTAAAITAEVQVARQGGGLGLRPGDRHGPFGIGLMAWALSANPAQFDATLEASPALVSLSFGDLMPWALRFREAGIRIAVQAGHVQDARAAADQGVDVIVARGGEGGGHGRDAVGTLPLLQGVLDAVDVPVLAAGGIVTARGLAAVLAAGAAGAWIGTALLASPEGMHTAAAKDRVRAARETDTSYGRVFDVAQGVPWPREYGGRALANEFSRRWAGREDELAADQEAQAQLADARKAGDYDIAYLYAGQGVGLVNQERPAAGIVADLAAGAERLLRRWGG